MQVDLLRDVPAHVLQVVDSTQEEVQGLILMVDLLLGQGGQVAVGRPFSAARVLLAALAIPPRCLAGGLHSAPHPGAHHLLYVLDLLRKPRKEISTTRQLLPRHPVHLGVLADHHEGLLEVRDVLSQLCQTDAQHSRLPGIRLALCGVLALHLPCKLRCTFFGLLKVPQPLLAHGAAGSSAPLPRCLCVGAAGPSVSSMAVRRAAGPWRPRRGVRPRRGGAGALGQLRS
mmetsp:Transcript_144449/g.402429  ORF Transcript_144449/g.402429 Transcript_144449/m.402429 type:complete len:229 (-) Transcript_144449:2-688(-)